MHQRQVPNRGNIWRTARHATGLSVVELGGCLIIAGLAVLPRILLELLAGKYSLPSSGQGGYPFVVFALSIVAIIAVLRPLYLVLTRHPAPTRQLLTDISENRGWIVMVALMVIALPETLDAATRFKKIIPQLNPFYADPFLADLERRILGQDAWRFTHAVFGPASTRVIDVIYGLWHIVNISVLTWIVLTRNRAIKLRAAISYQLAWLVMGAGLALAFSSVGPCFLEHFTGDASYRPLMEQIELAGGKDGLHSLTAMNYLLANEGKNALGGGISAMPSLHVGIAAFVVLLTTSLWPMRLLPRLIALVYFAAILVGSVHLGWHYLSDGIVGALGMALIWGAVVRTFVAMETHASGKPQAITTSPATR